MSNRHTPIMGVALVFVFATALYSQSSASKPLKIRNLKPGSVLNVSHPTNVTGEGVATPSGVKYWDIWAGEGSPASRGHVITARYTAWVDNGKEFASSKADGKPVTFTIGAGQVIPGWELGVEGMKPGGKRQIRIPAELAYGVEGLPPLIPSNATLIFDVEVIEVQ